MIPVLRQTRQDETYETVILPASAATVLKKNGRQLQRASAVIVLIILTHVKHHEVAVQEDRPQHGPGVLFCSTTSRVEGPWGCAWCLLAEVLHVVRVLDLG